MFIRLHRMDDAGLVSASDSVRFETGREENILTLYYCKDTSVLTTSTYISRRVPSNLRADPANELSICGAGLGLF